MAEMNGKADPGKFGKGTADPKLCPFESVEAIYN
jgi:hypothetical protein